MARVSVGEPTTLPLVRALCGALEEDRVRTCHWKSNAFLDRTRAGRNDLDLLIDRADGSRFTELVSRLGFKEAREARRSIPGILHYYGYDAEADVFVHVHAHYRLVVGDDLTKNYWIPLEHALLERAELDRDLRVPPPELELLVLVLRLVVKHATWDALLARRARVPETAREELEHLAERADEGELQRALATHLPYVDPDTFAACRRALAPGAGRWERARAGSRLLRELRPCARRSRPADVALKLWRRGEGLGRRVLRRPAPRKRLVAGGAVIALVGGDGAGKSTAVAMLDEWLSARFATTRMHLGQPPASRVTVVVRPVARVVSAASDVLRSPSAPRRGASGRPRAWAAVLLARDRALAVRCACRLAARGELVVCDRYPLPQLRRMDAPRLGGGASAGRRLERALARIERRYYAALTRPDVVIVLRADPEVAVERKPEERADLVRERWREIWDADWAEAGAHVLDADRPPGEVHAEMKALVWSQL